MADVKRGLSDTKIHVRLKLAALWSAVMFCYIYADYFGLYVPGALQKMIAGQMGPLGPTTQAKLVGASVMLIVPSLMIFLSVVLPAAASRWLNVITGALYTLIILLTMWAWLYSILYGVVEITLTLLVMWYAWTWPREGG